MSAIETIQSTQALVEAPSRPELVVLADHSKLTRWDKEMLDKGGHLRMVKDGDHLVEIHDTNNLFRNIKTLMLPPSDIYRQAFEPFYEQVKFTELLKRAQNNNPSLYAQALHYGKKGAKDFMDLQAHKQGTVEYKNLEAAQLREAEADATAHKMCMSRLYEALADAAVDVFENPDEAQLALDSLV